MNPHHKSFFAIKLELQPTGKAWSGIHCLPSPELPPM
jgi:hypothetical protein